MNVYAWVLLAALAVTAAVDWRAVATGQRDVEALAKPAYVVLLIAMAWLLHADTVDYGRFLLGGLAWCLVGDVALLGRTRLRILGGYGAFLLAQVCFVAALRRMPGAGPAWVPAILVGLVVLAVLVLRVVPLLRAEPRAGVPVAGYGVLVGAMAVLAWATGHAVLGLGATLVLASAALIGYCRYDREPPWGALVVTVTYHVGLVLFVLGMLRC